jgi:hypothetical protein
MMALAALTLALGAGAIGAGCSSNPTFGDESSFCEALAQADCSEQAVNACYLPTASTFATDTDACVAYRASYDQCNPKNLPYHPEGAAGCIAAHQNLYGSAPSLNPGLLAAAQQACAAVFNNGGETSSPCTADSDCDVGSGLVCLLRASGMGSCQTPVPTSPGESCASPAAQCVDNGGATNTFYCESSFHCVSDQVAGQMCGAGVPCSTGLRCVSGICETQLPDQASCTANGDCQGGFCISVGTGSICAGQPAPLAIGAPSCTTFIGK